MGNIYGSQTEVRGTHTGCDGNSAGIGDRNPGSLSGKTEYSGTLGSHRANDSTGSALIALIGGMLSQLIGQVESQLAETDECIDWYVNQKNKLLSQLEGLRQLQALEATARETMTQETSPDQGA